VSQTTPTPTKKTTYAAATFNPPLPGPNLDHTNTTTITGQIDGNNPQCRLMGVSQNHFILLNCAFGLDGKFTITISGGLLWDDTLYVLIVWSDTSSGSIFLDTRPPGV
jgi:hypothetical protein